MGNLLLIGFEPLPSWLIGIFVFCVLYPFCAVILSLDWPFEKSPSWKECLRQAEEQAKPRPQRRVQAQLEPQTRPQLEIQEQPELKPEPQTDPQLIEEAIGGICYLGFKKTEAKKVVNRVCNNRIFTSAEELIKAALDRSNV